MQEKRDKSSISAAHVRSLEALKSRNRYRVLSPRKNLDFASNDYLALANSPELAAALSQQLAHNTPVGATGSRLLRGNHQQHEALEAQAASHFQTQGALFFSSGFLANYAIFSTLPMRADLVVYDELIHASVHDGLKAGKAETKSARHNCPQSFNDIILSWRTNGGTGRVWIALESLYSMDGDRAPLLEFSEIANTHDAFLIIDEAHATGVYGPQGRGLASQIASNENVITMHTCGKALGAMGALICAPSPLLDFLINRSRAFIYSTAPSPLMAACVSSALKISAGDDTRRQNLSQLVTTACQHLAEYCDIQSTGTQIQPILMGSDEQALAIAGAMQAHGFDIRAIRPPTVPTGTSRLRLSFTLNVTPDQTRNMIEKLSEELARIRK